ncbi:NUDIX hydrolase [Streptomyces sp. NPDC006267]|uniref:NUDIX hydrolase n=1 Tax=Streptomyces sp. NPDC006267 TaxID=3157173 RepID=UPI0033B3D340
MRASAALWAGASVLITNEAGEVLVQEVYYRATRLLPGGGVDPGESPTAAASREPMEELGVAAAVDQALAVDWVAPDAAPTPAAMRFPGELLTVFDGGTWDKARIAEIQLPPSEITAISFVTPARLPDLLSPTNARRALSALRARINGAGTALLENGRPIAPTVLDHLQVPLLLAPGRSTARTGHRPGLGLGLRPRRPDLGPSRPGDRHRRASAGGKPEARDQGDPPPTLQREADEEAAARLGTPLLIGHVADPSRPRSCLRYAAALTGLGPSRPDPATGMAGPSDRTHRQGPGHLQGGFARLVRQATRTAANGKTGWPTAELDELKRLRRELGHPSGAGDGVAILPD